MAKGACLLSIHRDFLDAKVAQQEEASRELAHDKDASEDRNQIIVIERPFKQKCHRNRELSSTHIAID